MTFSNVHFSQSVANDDYFFADYYSNNKASFTWNHTTTTSANRILFVFVTTAQRGGTASGISSVTYGGIAMTQLAASEYQPALKSYLYYMLNPATGTNAVVVTPVNSADYFSAGSSSFHNVMQTIPVYNTSGGRASVANGSITTPYVNDVLLGFCGSDNNTNGVGAGQTIKYTAGSQTRSYVNLSTKTSAGSSETFSITIASTADYELILARLTPFGALPVTLANYELTCEEGHTALNWTTSSELNNDNFSIEKSDDAVVYSVIGKVEGNGTSNHIHHYRFIDEEKNDKVFYYRLKQTDYDGKTTTYNPLLSNCIKVEDIFHYPNPVTDKLHIVSSINFTSIIIYGADGRIMKQLNNENNLNNFNIQKLPAGFYTVKLITKDSKTRYLKILKN